MATVNADAEWRRLVGKPIWRGWRSSRSGARADIRGVKELGRVALERAPTLTSYIDWWADLRALFLVRRGRRFGLGFGFCGAVDGAVGRLGLQDYGSGFVFPNA